MEWVLEACAGAKKAETGRSPGFLCLAYFRERDFILHAILAACKIVLHCAEVWNERCGLIMSLLMAVWAEGVVCRRSFSIRSTVKCKYQVATNNRIPLSLENTKRILTRSILYKLYRIDYEQRSNFN